MQRYESEISFKDMNITPLPPHACLLRNAILTVELTSKYPHYIITLPGALKIRSYLWGARSSEEQVFCPKVGYSFIYIILEVACRG